MQRERKNTRDRDIIEWQKKMNKLRFKLILNKLVKLIIEFEWQLKTTFHFRETLTHLQNQLKELKDDHTRKSQVRSIKLF